MATLVSLIQVVYLDFDKFLNDPNVISGGWGKDDPFKKPEAKNLVTLPL